MSTFAQECLHNDQEKFVMSLTLRLDVNLYKDQLGHASVVSEIKRIGMRYVFTKILLFLIQKNRAQLTDKHCYLDQMLTMITKSVYSHT